MTKFFSAGRIAGLAASLSLFGSAIAADQKVVLTPEDGKTAQLCQHGDIAPHQPSRD